ncbi:uncharacterized protein [Argopecten irradians]|uniref:uncharacterized protein n=1 Tax=Argopecten irradians TaxID=31199 RepID=UPI003713FBC8
MPKLKEVMDMVAKMQEDLIKTNNTNLLIKCDSKKAWGCLTDDIKNKEKGKLVNDFTYFENIVHRDYYIAPEKLLKERSIYAKGREFILSTTEGYRPPSVAEFRIASNNTAVGPPQSSSKTNKGKVQGKMSAVNYDLKADVYEEIRKKASSRSPKSLHGNGYGDNVHAHRAYQQHEDKLGDLPNHLKQEKQLRSNTSMGMYDDAEREKTEMQTKIHKMEIQLRETRAQLHQAEKEKDYWVDRMSKVTGDKLTRDNPDIADLSDPKRPQKLGEQYSRLYDDDWTDAIEILTEQNDKVTERDGIDILLYILKGSYEKCVDIADDQFTKMQTILLQDENSKEQTNDIKSPIEVQRSLKDAQKLASGQNLSAVQKKVKMEIGSPEGFEKIPMHRLEDFVDRCTDICWAMVMQSPRMEFEYPECNKGEKFNKDHFKEFTKSGDRFDYLVWPAMVTHRQGPLLVRGTVQPINKR